MIIIIFLYDGCDYDYVLNTSKLCEPYQNNEMIVEVGCIHCKYNGQNKYIQCRADYIFIRNDYACKLHSEINLNLTCLEAIRLDNGQYSCVKCRSWDYALTNRFNNTSVCYLAENELVNCALGYEDKYLNVVIIIVLFGVRNIKNIYVIINMHLIFLIMMKMLEDIINMMMKEEEDKLAVIPSLVVYILLQIIFYIIIDVKMNIIYMINLF